MSFTSGRSRWNDVAVVAAAQLLGAMGTFLVMVTQILIFEQRGATGFEVAALIICESLPMVLLGKPIGLLVDRVDSRLLLVGSGLAQAAACLALANASGLVAVLGAVLALSAASAVSLPTRQALLPAMVHRDDLPRASAIGQTAGSLGMMAGPALAGLLFGGLGPQSTVRIAVVGFLATVVAAFAVRTRRGGTGARPVAQPAPTDAAESIVEPVGRWTLARDPLLRACVWSLTAVIATASAVNVVLVFFVMGTLGSTPQAYGVIDAMWMVGLLLGAWLCGFAVRRRTTDGAIARALVVAVGLVCVALVATGTAQGPWWIVPCYLLGGAANGSINVLNSTLIGRRVPATALGQASTAVAVRVQGGSLIGYVAGGLLLAAAQPRWIVLGCGVLGLLTALAALPAVARSGVRVAPWATGTASVGTTGTLTTAHAATMGTAPAVSVTAPATMTPTPVRPGGPS
jgi:MFS family permease